MRGRWFRFTMMFVIAVGVSALAPPAHADEFIDQACVVKCKEDARNKNKYLDAGDGEGTHLCEASCRISKNKGNVYDDLHSYQNRPKPQEWNPEHPVVRRCFQTTGFSDRFLDISNQAANNCIMEGLAAERAERDKARSETVIPIPRPKPDSIVAPSPSPPVTNAVDRNGAEISRLNSVCQARYEEVTRSCDQNRHRQLEEAAKQQVQPTNSAAAACGQAQSQGETLNAALSDFQRTCDAAVGTCVSSCGSAVDYAANTMAGPPAPGQTREQSFNSLASALKDACSSMRVKVSMVQEQTKSSFQSTLEAAGCAASVAASAAAAATAVEPAVQNPAQLDCAKTPDAPQCKQVANDCSNPQVAASDPVCICSRNPAACGGSEAARHALAGLPPTPIANSQGLGMLPGGTGSELDARNVGGGYTNPDGSPIMGGGGSAAGGGSMNLGDGKLNPSDPEQKTGPSISADINGGTAGGARRPGLRPPGRADRFGFGGGARAGTATSAGSESPNLHAFRPELDRRQLAGMGYRDGITGPHTDIWKKVSDRYHAIRGTLQP